MRAPRLGKLELLALVFGIFMIWMASFTVSAAWVDGWIVVLAVCFGMLVMFLSLHGIFVLWTVRRQGRVPIRRILLWLVTGAFPFSLLVLSIIYLGYAELVLENGVDINTVPGGLIALMVLWTLFP